MKALSLLISLSLIVLLSALDIQTKRGKFADNIQSFVKEAKLPEKWSEYVYNGPKTSGSIILYGLEFEKIDTVQKKFDLPEEMIPQIKVARFIDNSDIYTKLSSSVTLSRGDYSMDLGAAFREDNMVYFALIRAQVHSELKIKYKEVVHEKCSRFLFWTKCHDEIGYVPREYTQEEINIIQQFLDYKAVMTIKAYIPKLREGNYQAIISPGHAIYSEDRKSVVYFTDFGSLAIGPTSKLYVYSKPLKYVSYYDKEKEIWITEIKGDAHKLDCYISNVQTKQKQCYTFLKGLYWKYNLIGRTVSDYQRSVDRFSLIEYYKHEGPYILEIQNDGNMVITSEREDYIVWQSFSGGKGVGPYNLEVTNDKQLILYDSKDQIIYQSPLYRNVPTIDYQVYQKKWYRGMNGEIGGNTFTTWGIESISVKAYEYFNDTNMEVTYTVYTSHGTFTSRNGGNAYVSTKIDNHIITYPVEYFRIKFLQEQEYNLCYSAFVRDEGWTDYACNGGYVGRNGYSNTFNKELLGIMVFIVPKTQTLKKFSTIPAYKTGS